MKARISISAAIIIYALVTAVGLFAVLFTSGYALRQLRIGGPLYTQIKLGNDLVADILPPPEYVLEAYLEATLAMKEQALAKTTSPQVRQRLFRPGDRLLRFLNSL